MQSQRKQWDYFNEIKPEIVSYVFISKICLIKIKCV